MSSSSSGSSNGNGEQHQQPIPVLAPADVQHAISLIQAAYAPSAATDLPQLQSLQSALLAMQRTPAAWGLVVPLPVLRDALVGLACVPRARVVRRKLWRCRSQNSRVKNSAACPATYRPGLPGSMIPIALESLDVVRLLRDTDPQPLSVQLSCFPVLSSVNPPSLCQAVRRVGTF
ncbi:hypothetical protein DFH06DRAFT_1346326 [Mycena polygramma]|nr:hypothetical protein DFH06DRAFT_1346326 [Mycena polygramma]